MSTIVRCRFCNFETRNLSVLNRNQFKVMKYKKRGVEENDLYCTKCRDKIQAYVIKSIEKSKESLQRSQSLLSEQYGSILSQSSTGSFTTSSSEERRPLSIGQNISESTESYENDHNISDNNRSRRNGTISSSGPGLVYPRNSQIQRDSSSSTSVSISPEQALAIPNFTQRINEDPDSSSSSSSSSDEELVISDEVPGSVALANVQPLIRRRRDDVQFPSNDNIPIFRRGIFGG